MTSARCRKRTADAGASADRKNPLPRNAKSNAAGRGPQLPGVPTISGSGRFVVWTTGYEGREKPFAAYVSQREAEQVAALLRGWGGSACVRERSR
jgi:hypothetical protein